VPWRRYALSLILTQVEYSLTVQTFNRDLPNELLNRRQFKQAYTGHVTHFRDVLSSQSLGLALTKLNLTQKANNSRTKWQKHTKIKPKPTVFCKNRSYDCTLFKYTIQHGTVPTILLCNPSDNHHCSDVGVWSGGALQIAYHSITVTDNNNIYFASTFGSVPVFALNYKFSTKRLLKMFFVKSVTTNKISSLY